MKLIEKRRILEERYLDFFYTAMAILGNEQDARDAVQEALVRVLTTNRIKESILGYTLKTVRNCAIDILRYRRRFVQFETETVDRWAEHEAKMRRVAELCSELPEETRSLMEMHDVDGYTFMELSELTGLSETTVRRKVDEAHEIMKKRIIEEI